jgi:hypothetical protein
MPSQSIEEFAQLLVRQVRDVTIRSCDGQTHEISRSPNAKRWREAAGGLAIDPIKVAIPDIVDETIGQLLLAIDQGTLRLQFVNASETAVNLCEEGSGELCGWYMMGEGDWRDTYSKERFASDLGDA